MFEGLEEQKISCFEDFADDVLSSVWKQGKGPGTENSCWEGAEKINWTFRPSFGFGGQQNEEIWILCKILYQPAEKVKVKFIQ